MDDIWLGAPNQGGQDSGAAYLVLGQTGSGGGSTSIGNADTKLGGLTQSGFLGSAVAIAGDVNDDGFDDLLAGESCYGATGCAGNVYLIYGDSALSSNIPSENADAIFAGGTDQDGVGTSIAAADDVDQDGYADVVFGGPYVDSGSSTDAGTAYLFYGYASLGGSISASSADFSVTGAAAGDEAGYALAGGADANDDGYRDLLVGAPYADPGGLTDGGQATLWFGGGY